MSLVTDSPPSNAQSQATDTLHSTSPRGTLQHTYSSPEGLGFVVAPGTGGSTVDMLDDSSDEVDVTGLGVTVHTRGEPSPKRQRMCSPKNMPAGVDENGVVLETERPGDVGEY